MPKNAPYEQNHNSIHPIAVPGLEGGFSGFIPLSFAVLIADNKRNTVSARTPDEMVYGFWVQWSELQKFEPGTSMNALPGNRFVSLSPSEQIQINDLTRLVTNACNLCLKYGGIILSNRCSKTKNISSLSRQEMTIALPDRVAEPGNIVSACCEESEERFLTLGNKPTKAMLPVDK